MIKPVFVEMNELAVISVKNDGLAYEISNLTSLQTVSGGVLDGACDGNIGCGVSLDFACIDTNGICATGAQNHVDGACVNAVCQK